MINLSVVQQELYLAHKRGAWDTVVWLAPVARKLRVLLAKEQAQ